MKLTRLSQLAMVMLCSVAAYCQVDSSGRTAQYSNMYVVEDEGDFVGRRGINIKSGNNSSEFVPRRKNFLKQELFK